jgi:hypothetical protein
VKETYAIRSVKRRDQDGDRREEAEAGDESGRDHSARRRVKNHERESNGLVGIEIEEFSEVNPRGSDIKLEPRSITMERALFDLASTCI